LASGLRTIRTLCRFMVAAETSQVIEGVSTVEMFKKILITAAADPQPVRHIRTMCCSHNAGVVVICPETGLRTRLRATRRSGVFPRPCGRLCRDRLRGESIEFWPHLQGVCVTCFECRGSSSRFCLLAIIWRMC
jgi:hypothetical protein